MVVPKLPRPEARKKEKRKEKKNVGVAIPWMIVTQKRGCSGPGVCTEKKDKVCHEENKRGMRGARR